MVRIGRNENASALLVRMYIGTATMDNRMEDPQKIKNRTIAAILFLGIYPELTKAGS